MEYELIISNEKSYAENKQERNKLNCEKKDFTSYVRICYHWPKNGLLKEYAKSEAMNLLSIQIYIVQQILKEQRPSFFHINVQVDMLVAKTVKSVASGSKMPKV